MSFFTELLSPDTLHAAQSFVDYLGTITPHIVVEDIIMRGQELASSNIVVEDIIMRGQELASSNIVVEDIIMRGGNIVVEDIIM